MIGRTIREEDVQHGEVCWSWSLSAVNKQGLCVGYCTTVSDYTGRPSRKETKDPQFLDRWHTHIHTQDTHQGTERMRSFIWHFVCHWGLQGTHMYKHTHTFIANEWLGGWARAPPYQRKEPSSSQSKNVPAWAQKHQPLSVATDPSTSLKPHVLSHSEIGIRNMGVPLQEGTRHSHTPPFTGGGTGELNNLTSFHRTYPPFTNSQEMQHPEFRLPWLVHCDNLTCRNVHNLKC